MSIAGSTAGAVQFTSVGKQVLANGAHFADAVDPAAADLIVEAMRWLRPLSRLTGYVAVNGHRPSGGTRA